MSRRTRLFVWSVIAAMMLLTAGIAVWRADALTNLESLSKHARLNLTVNTFGLVFLPAWLALGALGMNRMLAHPKLRLADDQRRFAERSLVSAAIFTGGVHAWLVAGAIIGEPPGRELGGRLVEAVAGVFFIVNANFAAKTSPPPEWPDPGRWIRATLRTGWVGVLAGGVILASAIFAPVEPMIWIVGGATAVYGAVGVLSHLNLRRKRPA